MDEIAVYEGMCAVCAVLEEEEEERQGPHEAALRLAKQHLRLLLRLAEAHLPEAGGESSQGSMAKTLHEPGFKEASHVRQ